MMVFAIAARFDRRAVTRVFAAGGAWGLTLAAVLTGMTTRDATACVHR